MNTDQFQSPINFDRYLRVLDKPVLPVASGVVTEVIGLLIESKGPSVAIGDFCEISTNSGRSVRVQVIGFRNGHVLSMPLEETGGLQLGDRIIARSSDARISCGPGLLGRVLDGFGRPIDRAGPIDCDAAYDLNASPPGPLDGKTSSNG